MFETDARLDVREQRAWSVAMVAMLCAVRWRSAIDSDVAAEAVQRDERVLEAECVRIIDVNAAVGELAANACDERVCGAELGLRRRDRL